MRRFTLFAAACAVASISLPAVAQTYTYIPPTYGQTQSTVTRLPGGQTIYRPAQSGYGASAYQTYGTGSGGLPNGVPVPYQAGQAQSQAGVQGPAQPNVTTPTAPDDLMTQGVVRQNGANAFQKPGTIDKDGNVINSGSSSSSSSKVQAAGLKLRGYARVIDGNTLGVNGQLVVLYGADAPELDQNCNDMTGMPWKCGVAAKVKLQEYVQDRTVMCVGIRAVGQAVIATCKADGIDLAQKLVSDGMAVSPQGADRPFFRLENDAKLARRGMWAGTFNEPWKHRLVAR